MAKNSKKVKEEALVTPSQLNYACMSFFIGLACTSFVIAFLMQGIREVGGLAGILPVIAEAGGFVEILKATPEIALAFPIFVISPLMLFNGIYLYAKSIRQNKRCDTV